MRSGWPRRWRLVLGHRDHRGLAAAGGRAAGRRLWSPRAATVAGRRCSRRGTWPSSATGPCNRSYENYEASLALGRALPPETLVQGKLANGLALENRIRPIFIGHEFGNYADRKER